MFQPFSELTNRTPSPSQHEDTRTARKHSPWTAARHKKKTRSVQNCLLRASPELLEDCTSPEGVRRAAGILEDVETEYSLGGGLSSGSSGGTSVSPHSSPPIDRDQDAEVHPAKAYIVDQQLQGTSPDLLSKGIAAANTSRSPMWFGSSALVDELNETREDGQQGALLQHSSSAPSNILADRFDAVEQQLQDNGCNKDGQQLPQQLLCSHQHKGSVQQPSVVMPAVPAAAAVAGRRKGLVARRRSWTGAERRPAATAASTLGISRLAASSGINNSNNSRSICPLAETGLTGSISSFTTAAVGQQQRVNSDRFDSHLSLGAGSGCQQQVYTDCEDFCIRRLAWDHSDIGLQDEAGCDYKLAAAGCSTPAVAEDSVDWFEQQLGQAAEDDDLATAQQLWSAMQASGLRSSRQVVINYLMCCYYGGGDPLDAEQVVREMCAAADTEPDAVMLQLLASIDITWQQLHCGC